MCLSEAPIWPANDGPPPADARGAAGELTRVTIERGIELALARHVAEELMAKDAIGAHVRDELGISEISPARRIQAALTSAGTLAIGALFYRSWLPCSARAPRLH
jgi:hypothetical protein